MESIISLLFIGGSIALIYWTVLGNSKLPTERIHKFLDAKNLTYSSHERVKKRWNPNFEKGEYLFTFFAYRKHYFKIDALDAKGDVVEVDAIWYQSHSLFHKSKAVFSINGN
ncbi:hypothetical protein [Flagellimonas sp. 2504JD1-5]